MLAGLEEADPCAIDPLDPGTLEKDMEPPEKEPRGTLPCALDPLDPGTLEKDMEPPEKEKLDGSCPLDCPADGPWDVETVCCSLGLNNSWPPPAIGDL